MSNQVIAVAEKWSIPSYPSPAPEEMPMFAETRQHQGTTGNPYPNRIVHKVDRVHREDKEWDVVRLENDYIRVCILPALGGRIYEAYDKINDYHFLYRQHVIKPAMIGCYGSWISGGAEFNWPFHHRPSTFMPVDYTIETEEDGTAICWLSECDPTDRTKGMVGIVLRPDANYFETRVRITNRTALEHPFLWWENGAVRVHERYRLIFPPDVTWAHHHYDRNHITFPIAQSHYGSEHFDVPTDISWHGSTRTASSYFAAPSRFDFFGGYDYDRDCGTLHIADHHISPGKKMFTWGYGKNADNWEYALTDTDGVYAELMAGSYTDDQPDFTWLAPYETKTFSQFWYPTRNIKYVTCATLDAAASVDKAGKDSKLRLNVTSVTENATLQLFDGANCVLEEKITLAPGECLEFTAPLSDEKYTVRLTASCGRVLLDYTEITPDTIHIPKDNPGIPTPDKLKTAQENYIAGLHIDQYRDPIYKPDLYYLEALKYDPDHLPSLIALGEYYYRTGRVRDAVSVLEKALRVQNAYDYNPKDGTVSYLLGLCYLYLEQTDKAYDTFYKAAWSYNAIAKSMSFLAAIDCRRGEYGKMLDHAERALDKESAHPLAGAYAAYALYKLGKKDCAENRLAKILEKDPLDHLAQYMRVLISGASADAFFDPRTLNSNPSQTCMDVAFDLMNAGLYGEAAKLLESLKKERGASTMALYTLAYAYEKLGQPEQAECARKEASAKPIVDIFPYRLEEIKVLRSALTASEKDGTAWYLLGDLLYDKKQYACAAHCWEKAIESAPDFYIPYRNMAVACFSHLGREQDALAYQKKALELKSDDEQLLIEASYLMASFDIPAKERAELIEAHYPADPGDDAVLELAKAYTACGEYEKAVAALKSHTFVPGEGGEYAVSDTYMFSRFAPGRRALAAGEYDKALEYFRSAFQIPENLHASFRDESVTLPYSYYEAVALQKAGRNGEAEELIARIVKIQQGMRNTSGEFRIYSALINRLAGNEIKAQAIMREAILAWEAELADKACVGGTPIVDRFFYVSFIRDPLKLRDADLCHLLGSGALFFGDREKAKAYFEKSLALNPDNVKCALELELL